MALPASVILAFFAVRGFRYKITDDGFVQENAKSFFWLILMVFFVWVIYQSLKEHDKRLIRCSAFFGVVLSVFYLLGISMEKMHGIAWMWKNSGIFLNCLNLCISQAVLYYSFAFLSFKYLRDLKPCKLKDGESGFSLKRVLLFWGVLVLLYLPWYLRFFPGIISNDTADQIEDALTVDTINDHHSAFLTLMMRIVILPVRKLTGSLQLGIGACTLLQMLLVTFVFALSYEQIRKYLSNRICRALIFAWFAFYPVNNIYSVTLWKDILFSACFTAFLLCLDRAAQDERAFFSGKKNMFSLLLTITLMPLMRHNGISVSLIMAVYMLFRFREYKKQILKISFGFLLIFGLWKLVLLPALHVTEISSNHVLSVLEQQMARAMNVHHEELTAEEMAYYTKYFDIEDLWDRYKPYISDPVKRHFRDDLFAQDPVGFFRIWAQLGKRYPTDYIEAFLANNYGYWFPETRYVILNRGIHERVKIEDVHEAPVFAPALFDRIYEYIDTDQYAKTPLLSLFFSRGACFWLWIYCGCYCLYNNKRKFILFMAGFALWLGILISPVYNEYRYVYGLFTGLPLALSASLRKSTEKRAE